MSLVVESFKRNCGRKKEIGVNKTPDCAIGIQNNSIFFFFLLSIVFSINRRDIASDKIREVH